MLCSKLARYGSRIIDVVPNCTYCVMCIPLLNQLLLMSWVRFPDQVVKTLLTKSYLDLGMTYPWLPCVNPPVYGVNVRKHFQSQEVIDCIPKTYVHLSNMILYCWCFNVLCIPIFFRHRVLKVFYCATANLQILFLFISSLWLQCNYCCNSEIAERERVLARQAEIADCRDFSNSPDQISCIASHQPHKLY